VRQIRKRLTYANVTSTIALVLTLGGATAIAATRLPKNSVGTKQLKAKAVKTGQIARNAVRTGKIAPEAVRAGKIDRGAVVTNRLRNRAVSGAKLVNGAVGTGKLANLAVGTGKLGNESVQTGKIGSGAITTGKLADDSVTGPKVKESTLGQVPSAADADKLGGHSAACPAGTVLIRGVCFDSTPGGPTTSVQVASDTCSSKGGYLPTPLELRSARDVLDLGTGIGANNRYTDSVFFEGAAEMTVVVDDAGTLKSVPPGEAEAYVCAYPLVR
jgi:hypothetical protein